ncbi:MAG: amidohydrolase family protein SsnA [Spirochaetes bacterium]|nr:MAG: amidohydrolase family protein SsnA [Spirochaetota bacterium]
MILFQDVRLISFNPPGVSEPLDLAAGETILEIGKNLAAKYPKAESAGSGGYLSPGLVCSHTHLYSALARGIQVAIEPSKDFAQILDHLWWRLDRAIDLPILEASALALGAEALFCGVTSLVDHHAGPSAIDGSLSVLRQAYECLGIRGLLCYETTDRNGPSGAKAGVAENLRFAREVDSLRASGGKPLVEAAIGGHAGFTVGQETLEALADAVKATGRGIHIHVAEDKYDAVDSRHRYGLDLVDRLDRLGALTDKGIIGHGLWLTPSEIETMNARDAFLAHNARSNMNNAVGYNAALPSHRNVVLGTDGMGADMLEEFKFAVFRHREAQGPWWPGDFLACLDRGNRLLERYFAKDMAQGGAFGVLEPGNPVDLVHWDYDPPTPLEGSNLAGHLAFGVSSRVVKSVAVAGKMRIKDRSPLFDLEEIQAQARVQARRLWNNMEGR